MAVSPGITRVLTRVAWIWLVAGVLVHPTCAGAADRAPSQGTKAGANLVSTAVSVEDGVYSVEQSRRGEEKYLENCKRCHLRDLSGDFGEDAPPLVGEEFISNWIDWTVGDLFDFMITEMPPKQKDRRNLTPDTYADILAFILERNGFPAGPAELPPAFEPLAEIEMRSTD